MPIGLTPGHLSNRQATKVLMPSGLTRDVKSLRPTAAREEHRSLEADLNDEHNQCQANASKPDRPAAPLVLSAAFIIKSASRLSKIIGFEACCNSGRSTSNVGGLLGGCFPERISRTVYLSFFAAPALIFSSKLSTPFEFSLERVCNAPYTLPCLILLAKALARVTVFDLRLFRRRRFWIHCPSSNKASMSPLSQRSKRR